MLNTSVGSGPCGFCMDGTQAGYYYSPPFPDIDNPKTGKAWVIFLEGGGGCSSEASCRSWSRKKGGSARWPETKPAARHLSNAPGAPFAHAHHVYVPYCTADTHSGRIGDPTAPGRLAWAREAGYYFDGHLNLNKIVRELLAKPGSEELQEVLLEGTSAGGIGVFVHCDWLQQELGPHVTVKCAPTAGWFYPGFAEDSLDQPDVPPTSWPNWLAGKHDVIVHSERVNLLNPYIPDNCSDHYQGHEYGCMSVTAMYPHIAAPMFIVQNLFDSYQVTNSLRLPPAWQHTEDGHRYLRYYGLSAWNTTTTLVQAKAGDGLFLASCFHHGHTPDIGARSAAIAIEEWYFHEGEMAPGQFIETDPCIEGTLSGKEPFLPCNTDPACAAPEILRSRGNRGSPQIRA